MQAQPWHQTLPVPGTPGVFDPGGNRGVKPEHRLSDPAGCWAEGCVSSHSLPPDPIVLHGLGQPEPYEQELEPGRGGRGGRAAGEGPWQWAAHGAVHPPCPPPVPCMQLSAAGSVRGVWEAPPGRTAALPSARSAAALQCHLPAVPLPCSTACLALPLPCTATCLQCRRPALPPPHPSRLPARPPPCAATSHRCDEELTHFGAVALQADCSAESIAARR